jgi:hypothetical protein
MVKLPTLSTSIETLAPTRPQFRDLPLRVAVAARWLRERGHGVGMITAIFLLSRLVFLCAIFLGSRLVPPAAAWPGQVEARGPLLLVAHYRWDAIHYYTIAVGGYAPNPAAVEPISPPQSDLSAFFPLLPLLTQLVATALNGFRPSAAVPITDADPGTLLAGILVANAAALLACFLLYALARDETGDDATARRAVLYLVTFPLAFYYAVPYSEPLCLAAALGMFLAARRRRWVLAGVAAALATAARPVGFLLLPALAVEVLLAWRRGEIGGRDWPHAIAGIALSPAGIVAYMAYLWQTSGNPLAFVEAQEYWGRQRVFPWETLARGIDYALRPGLSPSNPPDIYPLGVVHTAVVVGFLAVLVTSARRWRPSYVVFGLLLFAFSLSSPWPEARTMHAMGRYVMILFPVYISLARWGRRPLVHQAITLLWLPLFGLLSVLYVCWHFVA